MGQADNNKSLLQTFDLSSINAESVYGVLFGLFPSKIQDGNYTPDVIKFIESLKDFFLLSENNDLTTCPCKRNLYLNEKAKIVIGLVVSGEEEEENTTIYICSSNSKTAQELHKKFKPFKIKKKGSLKTYLMLKSDYLYLKEFRIPEIAVDIHRNYNNDFSLIHEGILKSLKNGNSGLYLFHGSPGTGKTSYIKYLTGEVDKKFIFVPPSHIDSLSDPSFLNLLSDNKDSILILEDAERAVLKRDGSNGDSIVSNILNMSDGILGSVFNISLILSFNTSKSHVDAAILRKGRLKGRYDFAELALDKSNNLLKQLFPDKCYVTDKPLTLAQIYNFESCVSEPVEVKPVGFKSGH